MLSRARFPRLVDGSLTLLRPTPARDAPGVDFSTSEGCTPVASLHFASRTHRQQDVELADSEGRALSMKVLVRAMPGIGTGMLADIGGTVHEVWRADHAQEGCYLYLEELATDGTVQLVTRREGRDQLGRRLDGWSEPVTVHCRKAAWSSDRRTSPPVAALQPSLDVTIRRCDWGFQERVVRDGTPYIVESATSRGEWVEVHAERKAGNDGG